MGNEQYFSKDYAEAKTRFRSAGERAGAAMEELRIAELGPAGETLSVNFAYLGPERPQKLLLHTSGVHGVEGFAGSAIQIAVLENELKLPDGIAVAFVHCLNPFGMAWSRRVNENNVDLNRNFLAAGDEFRGCDSNYESLDPILNARPWPDWYWPQILYKLSRIGFTALKKAIVCGQYEFPAGLFFGGRSPEASAQLYRSWLSRRGGEPAQVLAIDVHTGLGKYGEEILFCHNNGTVPNLGKPITTLSTTIGYKARGGLETLTNERFPHASWIHFTQEFGTRSMPILLKALREENLSFRELKTIGYPNLKLREMMNPTDANWQEGVVTKGMDTLYRALNWLSHVETK